MNATFYFSSTISGLIEVCHSSASLRKPCSLRMGKKHISLNVLLVWFNFILETRERQSPCAQAEQCGAGAVAAG